MKIDKGTIIEDFINVNKRQYSAKQTKKKQKEADLQ